VAFVSFRLPSNNHTNVALSRLSSSENQSHQLRVLSPIRSNASNKSPQSATVQRGKKRPKNRREMKEQKKNELKKELRHHSPRDGITAVLLSKVLPDDPRRPTDPKSILTSLKDREKKKSYFTKTKKMDSKQQSTRNALEKSQPYAQKNEHDVSLSVKSVHAFAAEEYFDRKTRMEDNDDSLDYYYANDDDTIRGNRSEETYEGHEEFCTTPSFYRLYRPTCNELHSSVGDYQWLMPDKYMPQKHLSRYLGAGHYRQVFRLERQFVSDSDEVIFKSMKRLPRGRKPLEERAAYNPAEVGKNFELYDDMRKDSMVMELLTSSPRIADIYSFCALSSLIEYVPTMLEDYVMPTEGYEPKERDTDDDRTPVNEYINPLEKLQMALEMAKGLATMHGHSGGVIANVDVQIGQFCRGKDGLIKILDFNRAEVLLWDAKEERYCTFLNGVPPDGSVSRLCDIYASATFFPIPLSPSSLLRAILYKQLRAPEEIIDAPLTEKIDVYALGNLIYSVLTGLLVNRNFETEKAHRRITHGKTENIDVDYFDSRSPAEMALVKVIQWCWTFDANERPSIFQIVEFLEDEVRKNVYSSQDVY